MHIYLMNETWIYGMKIRLHEKKVWGYGITVGLYRMKLEYIDWKSEYIEFSQNIFIEMWEYWMKWRMHTDKLIWSIFKMQVAHIKHDRSFHRSLKWEANVKTWKHFQAANRLYHFLLRFEHNTLLTSCDVRSACDGSYCTSIGYITYRLLTSSTE